MTFRENIAIDVRKAKEDREAAAPPSLLERLSTEPAPGPTGPATSELLEWAKRRRRERGREDGGVR